MKKIVYGVIVALCGLFIAPDVEAQAGMAGSAKEKVAQDKFYPIEVTDMPQVLRDAVNTSYEHPYGYRHLSLRPWHEPAASNGNP